MLEGTVSAYTSVVLGGVFAKVGTPVLNAAFGKLSSRFSCATNTVVLRGAAAAPGLVEMGYGVYEISRGNVATGLMHIGAGAAGIFGASRIRGLCFVAGTDVWLERPHATLAAAGVGPGMGHDHTFVVILASGIAVAVVGQRVIEARAERKREDEETEEEAVDVFSTTRRLAVDRRCDDDDDDGSAWAADWWRAEGPMRENDEHLDDLAAAIVQAEHNADPRDLAFAGYARERGGPSTLTVASRAVDRPRATAPPRDLSFDRERSMSRREDPSGKQRDSQPKRSRLGRAWLFGVLLLTALLSIKFLPTGITRHSGESTALASGQRSAPAGDHATVDRVAIERVPIGHRALGRNPLRDQVDLSLPDPATWRLVTLRMIKANGYPLDIELLRPSDYLDLIGATPGGTIDLDLAEMGACGPAEVLSIGPCPAIPPGRGAVITGRFVHELAPGDKLIDVRIDGLPDPIGCTPNHLFWSETRDDFIPAADLQPGEQLLTDTIGPVQVASISPRPWEQYVYNLEVHAEHVYQVGSAGTLVHNSYANRPSPANRGTLVPRRFPDSPDGIRLHGEAKAFRKELTAKGADIRYRNIAVADVVVDGQRRTARFVNVPNGLHSEERLIQWFDVLSNRQGRSVQVLRVFSDRIPCGPSRANCIEKLSDAFGPDVDVFYNILAGPIP